MYHLTDTVSGMLSIPGYSGSSRFVPPYIQPHRHSVWNTKYPGILGILPSCPPIHTTSQTVSGILSIPEYSGSSRVVPPYIPPHRHSVRNTKYPGILGILPSCPPNPLIDTVSGILSIPGYSGSSRVVPPYIPPHRHSVRNTKYPGMLGILPSSPPIHTTSQTQCPEY